MIKRLFDVLVSAFGLVLVSPVILVVAVIVRITLGSPVLFRQKRPGFKGKLFSIYKFRSMKDAFDENGEPLPNELRLTRFGRFIRRTSLDELPGLLNVLSGDMSLVGPRPLKIEYLELYNEEQRRRHDVRPGITGWAQVNGRNRLSWEERFSLDVWYVDNQSLWLDIKILFLTVLKVVRRADVEYQGDEVVSRFTGTREQE